MTDILDMSQWYTAPQAIERLEANSGKKIDARYLRYLALNGKVEQYIISERVRLYSKKNIDDYVVEERGTKSGRAKRQKASDSRIAASKQGIQPKRKASKGGRPKKQQPGDESTDSNNAFALAF